MYYWYKYYFISIKCKESFGKGFFPEFCFVLLSLGAAKIDNSPTYFIYKVKIQNLHNKNTQLLHPYFSAKMTEEQVSQVLNELNGQILEEEIIDQEELLQYIDRPSSNTRSANLNNKKLNLESSLNLDSEIFNNNIDYTIDNNDSSSEKNDEEILQNIQDEEYNNENNNGVGNFNWDLNDLIIDNNDD